MNNKKIKKSSIESSYFEDVPVFLRDPLNLKLKDVAFLSKNLNLENSVFESLKKYQKLLSISVNEVNFFIGIPWDGSTAGRPGARFSAQKILEKFLTFNINHSYKKSIVILPFVKTIIGNKNKTFSNISKTVKKIIQYFSNETQNKTQNKTKAIHNVFFIGGDHSITKPIIEQYLGVYEDLNLLVFDSHFDLRIVSEGLSGGTYLQELMQKYNKRLNVVILGIKDLANPFYLYQEAKKYGVKYLSNIDLLLNFEKVFEFLRNNLISDLPVYISIDLDSIDINLVDSVNSANSFGFDLLRIYEIVRYIKGNFKVVSVDLVEFNPLVGDFDRSVSNVAELLYYISRD